MCSSLSKVHQELPVHCRSVAHFLPYLSRAPLHMLTQPLYIIAFIEHATFNALHQVIVPQEVHIDA